MYQKIFSTGIVSLIICKMFVDGVYYRSEPFTSIRTANIHVISSDSLVECAGNCQIDGHCNRMLYKSRTKQCILASHLLSASQVNVPIGYQLFYPYHADCLVPGYVFDPVTNTCLKLYYSPHYNWTDARSQCQSDGGDLIVIQNLQKWQYVLSYIDYQARTFIGLVGNTWINGDELDKEILNLTAADLYIRYDGDIKCGRIKIPNAAEMIRSIHCSNEEKFMCEIEIHI